MEMCEDCKPFKVAPSKTEPHAKLKLLGKDKIQAMGMAKGYVERYRCAACLTSWVRDCDEKDARAQWEPSASRK